MPTFYDAMFKDLEVNSWLSYLGNERASRIGDNGIMGEVNRAWEDGSSDVYQIESQRSGEQVFLAGVASHNDMWLDKGLRASEWALQDEVVGPNHDWTPYERNSSLDNSDIVILGHAMHPRSMELEAIANTAYVALKTDGLSADFTARAQAMLAPLEKIGVSMVNSGDVAEFRDECSKSSQLSFLAAGLQLIGRMTDNVSLRHEARQVMKSIIDLQITDGPDAGAAGEFFGRDSIYGIQTLQMTELYESTLHGDGAWANTVHHFNKQLLAWEVSRIDPVTGVIDCTDNTRQGPDGPPLNRDGPHGWDRDSTAIRLLQAIEIDHRPGLRPLVDIVQHAAQEYDHFEDIGAAQSR